MSRYRRLDCGASVKFVGGDRNPGTFYLKPEEPEHASYKRGVVCIQISAEGLLEALELAKKWAEKRREI